MQATIKYGYGPATTIDSAEKRNEARKRKCANSGCSHYAYDTANSEFPFCSQRCRKQDDRKGPN